MYPALVGEHGNPVIPLLVKGITQAGAKVADFHPFQFAPCPDVLHVHWLESVIWGRSASLFPPLTWIRAKRLIRLARRVKKAGGVVAWTVHNLTPHDAAAREPRGPARTIELLRKDFLPLVDRVVSMSAVGVEAIRKTYPELRADATYAVIPHPTLEAFFEGIKSDDAALNELGLGEDLTVLLVFGKVRRYKQIREIAAVFGDLEDRNLRLLVIGSGDASYIDELKTLTCDDRVRFIFRDFSHAELLAFLRRANFTLYNFSEIFNSGSVITAVSLGTPAIAPRSSVFEELSGAIGEGWIRCFDPPLTAATLKAAIESGRPSSDADFSSMNYITVGKAHLDAYGWKQ